MNSSTTPSSADPSGHWLARPPAGIAWRLAVWLALLLLLKLTAPLVVTLLVAALLFLLLGPAVEAMQRRGLSVAAAAAAVVFAPALALGLTALLAAPALAAWLHGVAVAMAELARQLQAVADDGPRFAAASAKWLLGQPIWAGDAFRAAFASDAAPAALAAAAVLMLVFFLLLAQRSLFAAVLQALPDRRARVLAVAAMRDARRGVATYLGTMALINLGLAVATGLALAALRVPAAAAWTAAVFVLLFIPYLGPLAAALLLAAAAHGEAASLVAIAAPPAIFLALHAVEAHLVSPWIMGQRLRLGRPALLVAVMAGAWAWGVVGGLLAVPLLIAAQAALQRRRGHALARAILAGESDAPPDLAASAAAALAGKGGRTSRRVRGMPVLVQSPSRPCASPTSPKPTRPKSTASR